MGWRTSSARPASPRRRPARDKTDSMRPTSSLTGWRVPLALLLVSGVAACSNTEPEVAEAEAASRWSHHDWPTGPYRVVEGWPKPLPDDRHSHDGWTWGSFGGVYAESPDRIWVAMRGELPLAEGAAPWTP